MFIKYNYDDFIYDLNASYKPMYDNPGDGNDIFNLENGNSNLDIYIYAYELEVNLYLYINSKSIVSVSMENIDKIEVNEGRHIMFLKNDKLHTMVTIDNDDYKIIVYDN